MNHGFSVEIATQFGINVAIFLENIQFWTHKNIANEKNYYEGRYWTYNTVKAFAVLFPYWTERQVRSTIEKCVLEGLLISGNYNKSAYDQTKWYALTEIGLSFFPALKPKEPAPPLSCPKSQMRLTPESNGIDQNVKPIPDINSNIITTTTTYNQNTEKPLCGDLPEKHSSSFFTFSVEADKRFLDALQESGVQKESNEFLKQCKRHLSLNDQKKYTKEQQIVGLVRLIREGRFEVIEEYKNFPEAPKINNCPFTPDELDIIAQYKHAMNTNQDLNIFFRTKERLAQAHAVWKKREELGAK